MITTYEYLDASNANGVEKLMILNYKIQLDKSKNKVSIYTDNVNNVKLTGFKKSFIKGFFKQYITIDIEI